MRDQRSRTCVNPQVLKANKSALHSTLAALDLRGPEPISIDDQWIVTPLGELTQRNGVLMYVGTIGRVHPLFERMKRGKVLKMKLGPAEMSLHLHEAKLAIDALEASCL